MRQYLSALIFLLFSCNSKQPVDSITLNPVNKSITAVQEKVDTVYNDYSGTDKFSELIAFGMTIKEWNKFIAQQAKKGVFEKIDNNGVFGSYKAFNYPQNQDRQGSFSIEARFIEPVKKTGNKHEFVRINNVLQSEPILNEVHLEYDTSVPDRMNQIVNEFIENHNLEFVAGLKPMIADDGPIMTIKDYQIDNELRKRSSENLANTKKTESQTSYTESVFENKTIFAVIIVKKIQDNELSRDYEGDVIAVEQGSTYFSIKVRACSKKFSNIDINEFRTFQQKEAIDARKKSSELIDKALEK